MVIQRVLDLLDVLYDSPAVLEVRQHTRRPALVEERALVVVESDCRVDEGCDQGEQDQSQVLLGKGRRDLRGLKGQDLLRGQGLLVEGEVRSVLTVGQD